MESGIIPAIISFIFPGIGQALTDGKPTGKWIVVFILILIVYWILFFLLGTGYTFYGIEVEMNEDEARRLESGIPYDSSLGFWMIYYEKGKVKEIHTYHEG